MEKVKKQSHKRWWVWFIVAAAIGVTLNACGVSNNDVAPAMTNVTNAPTLTPVPAFTWASAEVTPSNVKTAIAGKHWNRSRDDYTKFNVTDGNVDIRFNLKNDYGAQDELMQIGNTMVVVAEILFKNPAVKSVGVWGDSTFIDLKGNDVNDLGAKLIWDRSTIADIDFKKYRDLTLVDYSRPFLIGYAYSVHPAIYKTLSVGDKNGLPMMK